MTAAVLVAVAHVGEGGAPAKANGPGTSFSIDLDPDQGGIQATRSVPIGTPFSVALVLDATDVASFIQVDAWVYWDDVRLTAPLSGVPLDWADPPAPGPVGGQTIPFAVTFDCPPSDAPSAIRDENGAGTAWINMGCNTTDQPQTSISYVGSLFEFVLVCDSSGSANLTINSGPGENFILDTSFNNHNDHQHNATVTCTDGSGDTDGDGMPDTYENQHLACLNPNVADATGDPDADNYTNMTEYQDGTDPCDADTDNDGCADSEEADTNQPQFGGQRDPLNQYDFYDVNGSRKVDASDIGLVRSHFNQSVGHPSYSAIFDRAGGAHPWAPGAPNGTINAVDIGLVRASFNHNCTALPN